MSRPASRLLRNSASATATPQHRNLPLRSSASLNAHRLLCQNGLAHDAVDVDVDVDVVPASVAVVAAVAAFAVAVAVAVAVVARSLEPLKMCCCASCC